MDNTLAHVAMARVDSAMASKGFHRNPFSAAPGYLGSNREWYEKASTIGLMNAEELDAVKLCFKAYDYYSWHKAFND